MEGFDIGYLTESIPHGIGHYPKFDAGNIDMLFQFLDDRRELSHFPCRIPLDLEVVCRGGFVLFRDAGIR